MNLRFYIKYFVRISYITLLVVFVAVGEIKGQSGFLYDTIHIEEVIVKAKRPENVLYGFKSLKIDELALADYNHELLGELIQKQTVISIKSYGAGGISTPSFRGTGAGHTQVVWNNVNVNNVMLGQSDMSLIPIGIIDEVDILFGGASLKTGSGGIGGMVVLNNKPNWDKKTSVTISPAVGSFGNYAGIVKVKTGGTHFQSVTRAYANYAENNFTYINKVRLAQPVRETMQNSQSYRKGLLQELYYKNNDNLFSGKFWISFSDRNLPANMLENNVNHSEKQIDKSLITLLSYEGKNKFAEYHAVGAYSRVELNYLNKTASINSANQSDVFTLKTGITSYGNSLLKAGVNIDVEHITVNTVNYENGKAKRNNVSLTGRAGLNDGGRFSASFLLKETIIDVKMYAPDFSAGLKYRLNHSDNHFLKANFSRVSKFPSMNDLFWSPGGNRQLQNEIANIVEFGYGINRDFEKYFSSGFEVTFYDNSIKNLIQWTPGQYSYWVAENLKKVNCSGIETSGNIKYSSEKISASLAVNYAYNNSTVKKSDVNNDESVGKQLIYVPKNQTGVFVRFAVKNLSFSWTSDFTGKRYTTADNSRYLPNYTINSLSTGYMLIGKSASYNFNFKVNNIFDADYESIAYYAQPGRNYSLKLTINLLL